MLLPSVEALQEKESVRFLMVFGPPGRNGAELWGLFPLKIQRRCLDQPIRTLERAPHDPAHPVRGSIPLECVLRPPFPCCDGLGGN